LRAQHGKDDGVTAPASISDRFPRFADPPASEPIIEWNSAMISRASTRVGTPASIAVTVTVSAFESVSRPTVMRRAIVLADGIR